MKRRQFLEYTSVAGLASFIRFPKSFNFDGSKYKMGYQLFSIRDEMAKDPIATLVALKEMGYADFEIYGYDENKDSIYGFKPGDFKTRLDDMGLTTTSGHYGFSPYLHKSDSEMRWFVDKCIVAAKKMNQKYITWPWLHPTAKPSSRTSTFLFSRGTFPMG